MKEIRKQHYAEMNETEKLEAEARRLMVKGNEDAIIALLSDYNKDWKAQGKEHVGNMIGIHLHFGLKENSVSWNTGAWVNPEPYLTGEKSMRVGEAAETVETAIKKGEKVKVLNAVDYSGKPFRVWFDVYEVLQVDDDRVVIGIGDIITAEVRMADLKKV